MNVFVNDRFAWNIIPPVPTIRQMVVKEEVNLNLGINSVRVEVIGVSGKKSDSEKTVIYDIASARYYALVIAVEKYNDPAITDLDKPVEDASRFLKVIQEEYTFEPDQITFLKNPTKGDIIGTLHNLRTVVTPSDNLLIYYAGHGYWDEEMQTGYWLPRDARRDNPVDWLPNTDLTNYLNALKTKHTLLIADACFSGGIFKTRSAFNDVMSVEKLYRLKSRKALTSGNLTEVPDESAFVKYLIQLLEENNKEYLTAEDLYLSLRKPVENNSPNVPKYGVIQNVGDEGGDFVFIRKQE
ncbi:MAG: caspase family protein [Bacteroidales bacterium]